MNILEYSIIWAVKPKGQIRWYFQELYCQMTIKDFLSTIHDLRLNLVPTITGLDLKKFPILSSNSLILHLYKEDKGIVKILIVNDHHTRNFILKEF